MRISTNGLAQRSLDALLKQQASASRTQTELASGKKLQTPSDDPVSAVRLLDLKRALDASDQYARNAEQARNRLSTEEQALSDTGALFQQVRERIIQANSGAVSSGDLRSIATALRGRFADLTDIANRRDTNGDYLFAGFATKTQPFTVNGTAVSYQGDQGTRQLQIGPTQRVTDSDSGFDVFLGIPQGNGTFATGAASTNTGTGVIGVGTVTNPTAVMPGDYTIEFDSATQYRLIDANGVETPGNYTNPGTVAFGAFSVQITGAPAAGDRFTIARSRSEDVFTTLDRAITALETAAAGQTPASRAQFATTIGSTLQQLDRIEDRVLSVRTTVGTRLNSIDTSESVREDDKFQTQSIVSGLEDLDYTEAITRLQQQLTGLQAAQQSYAKLSQLSLFEYLR
jgi:flagellar hook-associated protein 3 FlgL